MVQGQDVEKARAALQAARFRDAVKHFDDALAAGGDDAAVRYERAAALEGLGRFDDAIADLARAVALDPTRWSAPAAFSIGNCRAKLGDLEAAVAHYDQALALAPDRSRVWHNRGAALRELGRLDQAAESYARAAALAPDDVDTALWLRVCREALGQPADPAAVPAAPPESEADAWMQVGAAHHAAGAWDQALAAYDRALALRPGWGVALVRRGACLGELGRYDEAQAALAQAAEADRLVRLTARLNQAALAIKRGAKRTAEALYAEVAASPPASAEDHGARAHALLALGRTRAAAEAFALALRLDPHQPGLAFGAAVCRHQMGDAVEAARAYQAVIARSPGHVRAWIGRARCLLEAGLDDEVNACCERAAALGIESDELWFCHGTALLRSRDPASALPLFERTVAAAPSSAGAWVNLASCYHAAGRAEDALRALDSGLRADPNLPNALHARAAVLDGLGRKDEWASCCATGLARDRVEAGQPGEAVARLVQAVSLDPANWLAERMLADLLLQGGYPEEASPHYARYLALRPDDAMAWTTHGVVLDRLGRGDEATHAYEAAVEVDPRCARALRNLAGDRLAHDRPADAVALCDRALAIEGDHASAWYLKGVGHARLDAVTEAVAAFQHAVELAPEDVEAWKDLATCLEALARHAEAIDALNHVKALDPTADLEGRIAAMTRATQGPALVDLLAARGLAALQRGDHAAAREALDAALAIDPARVALWENRGIVADALGDGAQAIACFDRALAIEPDRPSLWYNRGVSAKRIRRYAEAIASFEKVVELHRAGELAPDEDLLHGLHEMGSCLVAVHRDEDAVDAFDEVIRLARTDPERWREETRRAEHGKRLVIASGP